LFEREELPFRSTRVERKRKKEVFPMSGAPHPFRFITFIELNMSGDWSGGDVADDGFTNWELYDVQDEDSSPSLTITRSDGKVLSFPVTKGFGFQTLNNLIKLVTEFEGSDGPFQ